MILFRGMLIGLTTIAAFSLLLTSPAIPEAIRLETARTGALVTLILTQLIHVFECKTEEGSIFSVSFFNNKKLLAAALVSTTVLILVLYVPWLQMIFSTVPLTWKELLWPVLFCFAAPLLRAVIHH